jgi:hypothetical protein
VQRGTEAECTQRFSHGSPGRGYGRGVAAPSDRHYTDVALGIRGGEVVPFLGAGSGVVARAAGSSWQPGDGLPTGTDLARHLARQQLYSDPDDDDLLHVAQFVATMSGYPRLYKTLHRLFDADFAPNRLHRYLAGLPAKLSGAPHAERDPAFTNYQLIVTTNYDDTLERAFRDAGEPYELITYKAEGEHRGRFVHWLQEGGPQVITEANSYVLSLSSRTVILKIHGMVVRGQEEAEWESFVITEDHYIEYLLHTDIAELLPVKLVRRLRNSNLLFLGYGLRDWNLRVILQSIWTERDLSAPSWAVQVGPDDFDREFWKARDITIFDQPLDEYIAKLDDRVREVLADKSLL